MLERLAGRLIHGGLIGPYHLAMETGAPPPPPPPPPPPGGGTPGAPFDLEPDGPRPRKGFSPVIAIIAVVVVALGVGAFFLLHDDSETSSPATTDRSEATDDTRSDTTDDSSDTTTGDTTEETSATAAPTTDATTVPPSSVSFGMLQTLRGHTSDVLWVAFSPDGRQIVSGSKDGTARLWDVASGQTLKFFDAGAGYVYGAAISADGSTVITANEDGTLHSWDIASGLEYGTLNAHSDLALAVDYSPRYSELEYYFASAGADGVVRMWDANVGEYRWETTGSELDIGDVDFDPVRHRIVTCNEGGLIQVWDLFTSTARWSRDGHSTSITTCAFDRTGERIVTASKDGTVAVWKTGGIELISRFTGHQQNTDPNKNWVLGAVFDPTDDLVYSVSQGGVALVSRASTGELVGSLGTETAGGVPVNAVDVSPDGRLVAVGDDNGNIVIWTK